MLDTLTKATIVERLIEDKKLNKPEVRKLVDGFFELCKDVLGSGELLKFSGFGNFDLRDKDERPGRNPKTGEVIPVKARRVVTFKSGQKLRQLVENCKLAD